MSDRETGRADERRIALVLRREDEAAPWLGVVEERVAGAGFGCSRLWLDEAEHPSALEALAPDLVLFPLPDDASLREVVSWLAMDRGLHSLLLVGGLSAVDVASMGRPSIEVEASIDTWRVALEEALGRGPLGIPREPLEGFFRATFEASPVAMLVAPRIGEAWISNAAFAELLGYDHDEFAALGVQQVIHPDDVAEGMARFGDLLQGRSEGYEIERRYFHKDGRAIWGRSTVRRIDHGDGGPPGIITTFQDVHEQRQTREILRETQALLSQMLDSMPEIFWALTPDWKEVRFVSQAWEATYGLPRASLIQRPALWREMIHEADRERTVAYFDEHHGTICETDYRIVNASGDTRWIRDRAFPIRDEAGELILVAGFGTDITEARASRARRKVLEEQMLRSQKLQSLGLLAGGVAHDFNNLLTVVLANASLLERPGHLDEAATQRVAEIVQASNQAADLCRQMLTFAGQGPLSANTLDLNKIVTEMLAMLEVTLSRRHVVLRMLEPELPPLTGDVTQLRQLVMNLILNAAEASPASGGRIIVTTTRGNYAPGDLSQSFLVPNASSESLVVFEVRDEGCGMDGETLELIFDPFFTSKEGGRGLGLAAVLGIVRAHSGAISVESQEGRGSAFRLYFPPGEQLEARSPDIHDPGADWVGEGTLLVVDDQEQVLDTTRRLLELLGFEVLLASGGAEAVELFEAQGERISGVLLDLTMPGMDGVQTLRALRKLDPAVKVILASGYASESLHAAARSEEVAGTLEKPFDLKALSRVLRAMLEQSGAPD